MDKMTKTLFGGALMTAGLATGAAAQQFTQPGNIPPYADDFTAAYVYDFYAFGGAIGGVQINGGFPSSYDVGSAYGSAEASITNTTLDAYAEAFTNSDTAYGFSYGAAYGYLSVTADAALNLAWDFTAEGAGGPLGVIQIVDWSAGGVLVFETTAFTADVASVDLFAGTNYGILVRANAGPGGSAFASAQLVPTPGALSMLGLAGLAAARRRR
ncbi:MAG: hypothetical protein AAGI53_15720 [Planctomycetota bacterium]